MAPSEMSSPKRVLGVVDSACVVIGAIIGVGIFFSPGNVVRITGDGTLALVAWSVAGVIALCGALVFAELGARYHAAGAQYEILRDSYGPLPAFMFVFCNATAIQAGATGIIAVICVENIAAAMGAEAPKGWNLVGIASVLVMGVMGANLVGVKAGSAIQNVTVFAKVITLLAVTLLALLAAPAHVEQTITGPAGEGGAALGPVKAVMAALIPAFFAFGGWQHALWISGEVKDPVKTLPRSIVAGVLVVIAVYLLANWAYLTLLGADGVAKSKALAADAVGVVWPSYGRRAIGAAVALSAFGVLNAQLLSGPRLVYGMARDGRFFRVFARLSPRWGTPVGAILLIGVMAIVLLAAAGRSGIDRLLTGAVFIDGVFFALTAAALFVLRGREGRGVADGTVARAPGFRVPGYPLVPLCFVVGELALLTGSYFDAQTRQAAWIGVAWIGIAAVVYAMFFRREGGRG